MMSSQNIANESSNALKRKCEDDGDNDNDDDCDTFSWCFERKERERTGREGSKGKWREENGNLVGKQPA